MLKLTYLSVFFIVASFVSCEKKVAAPAQSKTPPPVTKDTLSGKIYLFAGKGEEKDSGDGGPATKAEFSYPDGIVADAAGNIYISDAEGGRVRKVDIHGIVSTYVGTAIAGYSGDGGPATSAELLYPGPMVFDNSGNLYISDNGNYRIRKVDKNGTITTYAGNGNGGEAGDGGPAINAEINSLGLATDDSGNIYMADGQDIRKINTRGIITTIAGNETTGYSGDGGPATKAQLNTPQGVALDHSGNIYIADGGNDRIRMVNTQGIITTIAGNGFGVAQQSGGYSGDGGPAINAELFNPTDVSIDASGNIYIEDTYNYCIRVVNTKDIISTIVGIGKYGDSGDGGPAIMATLGDSWVGMALDNSGNIYITDLYNNKVRVVYK